jgi:hypothetical protein
VSATAGAALVAAMFALPGAGVAYASDNGNTTGNGNVSVLSGNSITAPVSAPVNLCGISLAVAGFSNAGCEGGSTSCIGSNCNTPCTHNCTPPCRHNCHTPPPGCTANCGGTPPGGTPPGGTGPGTTTVSTGTSPAGLPTTGADLLLLGVAALGTIGVGAGAVAVARRRRNSEV